MLDNEKVIRDFSGNKQNCSLSESSTMILVLLKIECSHMQEYNPKNFVVPGS